MEIMTKKYWGSVFITSVRTRVPSSPPDSIAGQLQATDVA